MAAGIATTVDVVVVGGGPGGYVAAIRASQLGLDVALVEMDAHGGACLNRGCIPSKAFVTAADLVHSGRNAEHMGLDVDVDVDFGRLRSWKDGVVDRLTGGVEQLCEANGVTLVDGRGAFSSDRKLRVHGSDDYDSVEFDYAVVATGSRPVTVPGFEPDGKVVLDSTDALALSSLPERLVVIGGGYIGMELSTVYAKLGTDVTVVEMLDRILPGYEPDVARVVRERAEELGITVRTGLAADGWERDGDGAVVRAADESGDVSEFGADNVLVAVGRKPVTDTLDLDAVGIEPGPDGFLETDDRGRTNVEHVFAVGDVAGEPMLAHKASYEGEVAAAVIAGEPAARDYRTVPAVVFTDPEVGTVGMTEAEAAEAGFDPAAGTFPLRASGRALTLDETEGFVRVVADADTEFVLGAQIVAPEASELVAELGLAVEMGATLEDVIATVHTHPTLSEAVREAAANARGEAIHTLNR